MALISKADLRSTEINRRMQRYASQRKSASQILTENAKASLTSSFDVFLSHSYRDAQALGADDLLRLKNLLESFDLTVYVDWLVDRQLSRETVNSKTAELIRTRMDQSKCLLFATSARSSESRWMPWELGYKDGASSRAAILPIVDQRSSTYDGQEYLGLYPYVTQDTNTGGQMQLWVETSDGKYVAFNEWLRSGKRPYKHTS